MSDRQLFQNTDEQEAAYAPQQLPEGTAGDRAADVEEGEDDRGGGIGGVVLPLGAAGIAAGGGGAGGLGASSGTTGTGSGVGPAIGAAALADETSRDDEDADRR